MDSRLIAKIRPTKKDGKRTIGTGYPIGKDLVLTVRHVVFPHWVDTGNIEIEWVDLKHSRPVTDVVFDGAVDCDPACDIVVLRCQTPPQAHVSALVLAQQAPDLHKRWDSLGYSRLGKDEVTGDRQLVSALGEFHHPKGTDTIELTSKSDAKDKNNWKGLSGAPVFQNRQLYAVIIETPEAREECFSAIYIPYLLKENPLFREAVGLGQVKHDFKAAIVYLQTRPDACRALRDELVVRGADVVDAASALVFCLVRLPIPELFAVVRAAQRGDGRAFDDLRRLVQLLLPSLYGFDHVTTLRASKGSTTAGIVALPYATEMSAETLMAATDGRAADFRVETLDYGLKVRAGKYCLPLVPESGRDKDGQAVRDVDADLSQRLCGGADMAKLRIGIDEHLFKQYPGRQNRGYKQEDKRTLVSAWLEREAGKENAASFYWIFQFGDDEAENECIRQFARELKACYPRIVQLSLDYDIGRQIEEDGLSDALAYTQIPT